MTKSAHIFQINASKGGVPKTPLREAEVTELGLTADKQKNLKFHGGPTRALCLFSLEKMLELQQEGHPIYPGSVGENITVSGVPWDEMTVGSRWRLGSEVEIEITSFAVPCQNISQSFADEKFVRLSQKKHPGWARVYASVQKTGAIQVGDVIEALE